MPGKGQTCSTCEAICCHGNIAWELPADWKCDTRLFDLSLAKARELMRTGKEIWIEGTQNKCSHLTNDCRCDIHDYKPAICRIWYCHGKYWRPK